MMINALLVRLNIVWDHITLQDFQEIKWNTSFKNSSKEVLIKKSVI